MNRLIALVAILFGVLTSACHTNRGYERAEPPPPPGPVNTICIDEEEAYTPPSCPPYEARFREPGVEYPPMAGSSPEAPYVAAKPPSEPPVKTAYYKLAPNEVAAVELIAREGIWFTAIWGDLHLEEGWREKLASNGLRLEPAPAGYWCGEVMVVRGPTCHVLKKWCDVRNSRVMANERSVSAQIHKLAKTNSSGPIGDLYMWDGSIPKTHLQVLFALNRVENLCFTAPSDLALTSDGRFSNALYQHSY